MPGEPGLCSRPSTPPSARTWAADGHSARSSAGSDEGRAVGRGREPPVLRPGPAAAQVEVPGHRQGPAHVGQHGQQEGAGRQRGADRPPPPPRHGDKSKNHERNEQDSAYLPDRRGAPQDQRPRRDLPPPGCTRPLCSLPLGPEQHRQPGPDQGLEEHVRHDRLLELQLIGVEQDRGGGQRGGPARYPVADQQQVDGDGQGQPEQMLGRGHQRDAAERVQRPQQDLIALGLRTPGAQHILRRVDVQQGRPVSQLGQHPQPQPGR